MDKSTSQSRGWWVAALVAVAISAGALPAKARGPLTAGELVILLNGYLIRSGADGTPEGISTITGKDFAIAGPNTIFVLSNRYVSPQNHHTDIHKVDVRDGAATLFATRPEAAGNQIAITPSGDVLAVAGDGLWHFDRNDPTQQTFVSGGMGGCSGFAVSANGTIYMPCGTQFARLIPIHPFVPDYSVEVEDIVFPAGVTSFITSGRSHYDHRNNRWFTFHTLSTPVSFALQSAVANPVVAPGSLSNFWMDVTVENDGHLLASHELNGILRLVEGSGIPGQQGTAQTELAWSMHQSLIEAIDVVDALCSNGIDDDGDGLTDYAADGSGDPDCTDFDDDREVSACSDGIDNDNDGTCDWAGCPGMPPDPECAFDARSDAELSECNDGVGAGDLEWIGTQHVDFVDQWDEQCTDAWDQSEYPECSDGLDNDGNGATDYTADPQCYGIPQWDCEGPPGSCQGRRPACSDGWDNDLDGFVDTEDPDCFGNGSFPSEKPACNDGEDNDGDGDTDMADSDCDEEAGKGEAPECQDGHDNDADGLVDYPSDPDCASDTQRSELPPPTGPPTPTICTSQIGVRGPSPLAPLFALLFCLTWIGRRRSGPRPRGRVGTALVVLLSCEPTAFAQQTATGSGQFTGLAAAPEANLFSGAMTTSVPIQIPKGRETTTPDLKLVYSSGGGDGPFGYGWSLPLGSVERSTKHGRPRCAGANTRKFVLSLSGNTTDLVYQGPANQTNPNLGLYHARVDEAYLEAIGDETDPNPVQGTGNNWTITDRTGMTYRFGIDSSSRAFHEFDRFIKQPPVTICEFTSIWALNEMVDPNGNAFVISYHKDGNTLYPDEILYGANPSAGLPEHPFKVKFLRSPRAYPVQQSHRGVEERIDYVIERIEVFYRPTRYASFEFVRAYDLTYTPDPTYGRMLLTKVDDDHDANPTVVGDLLPAQTFEYSGSLIQLDTTMSYTAPAGASDLGHTHSDNGVSTTDRAVMDMNGDGRPDLVHSHNNGTAWTVYPGTASGFSTQGFSWSWNGHFPSGATDVIRYQDSDGGDELDPSATWVIHETTDLTGDGIPDWVDSRNTTWTVYPGSCDPAPGQGPNDNCGFGDGIAWVAPSAESQRSSKTWTSGPDSYWSNDKTLIDVTGDGRVDLVVGGQVFENKGTGFDLVSDISAGGLSGWVSSDTGSTTTTAWFDFNGDGLPDLVNGGASGTLNVSLNSGRGLGAPISVTVPVGTEVVRGTSVTGSINKTSRTYVDFFDVNGDGLPDRIYWMGHYTGWHPSDGDEGWRVQYNLGGTALSPLTYEPASGVNLPDTWEADLGALWNFTDVDIEGNGGVSTDDVTKTSLMDFNGDGFLDRVDANTWTVHLGKPVSGPEIRPLLMVSAHNGIGGVTNVSYAQSNTFAHSAADGIPDYDLPYSSWVVTQIRKGDGISPDLVQNITYTGGLFDNENREFRGFRWVSVTDSDNNVRETEYYQSDFDRGKVKVVRQFVGAQVLEQESFVWTPIDTGTGRVQLFLAERKKEEFSLVGDASLDRCVLNRNEAPDGYGRVTHSCSLSCGGDAAGPGSCANPTSGQVDTFTSWSAPVLPTLQSVLERPATVKTCYTDPAGTSRKLAEKQFNYDGYGQPLPFGSVHKGNLRRVDSRKGPGGTLCTATSGTWTYSWNSHDAFGNIEAVMDPLGAVSGSVYDLNQFSLYPVTERNALLQEVHTVTDLRYGKPTRVTGLNSVNGEVSFASYDGLGRLLCEAKPGQTLDNCHTGAPFTHATEYRYAYGDPNASAFEDKLSYVEVRAREPNADGAPSTNSSSDYLIAREYTDGLGRARLRTREQVIDSDVARSTVVTDHVEYGAGGRIEKKFVPYALFGAVPPVPAAAYSEFFYGLNGQSASDPRGRVHRVVLPDLSETTTFYEGVQTRVINAQGTPHEHELVRREDDFGRLAYKLLRDPGNSVTWSSYTHDGMGRALTEEIYDDIDTRVTHTYDLLGHKTVLDDPNGGGVWAFIYDDNGNLLSKDDPKQSQHIQFLYDVLGRVTHVCAFTQGDSYVPLGGDCGTAAGVVTESVYTHDQTSGGNAGLGRLTRVVDSSGFVEFTYDARGRVTRETRDVLGKSATLSFLYDDADRVVRATYPDDEKVNYAYDDAGQLVRLSSMTTFVNDMQYDLFGRVSRIARGNGTEDVREFYGPEENFRLKKQQSLHGAAEVLDLEYQYNALAKVERVLDHRDGSGELSNEARYGYDTIGRLVSWDRFDDGSLEDSFEHSPLGNLTKKGGADLLYADSTRPHQVTSYAGKSYFYDDNGARTDKGAEQYTYDALGRLTQVSTAGGDTVEYLYDYAGQRTAKRVNYGPWTRYFGDAVESKVDEQGNGWLYKYYVAGSERVAFSKKRTEEYVGSGARPVPFTIPGWFFVLLFAAVVVLFVYQGRGEVRLGVLVGPARAAGSTLLVVLCGGPALLGLDCSAPIQDVYHYHTDHLGSVQAVTNRLGTVTQQVRYEPWGAVRSRFDGAGVAVADSDAMRHEFTGYESEIESGLQYAGARYYDPEVGQFLTHDPERQYASPYAYGPGDPMNGTDPDGRVFDPVTVFFVLAIAGAVAAGADAYRATGNWGDAFKAAAMSFAGSIVSGIAFQAIAPVAQAGLELAMKPATAALAIEVGMAGYGAYGVVQSVREGQYASALVGAASLGLSAYGLGANSDGERTSAAVSGEYETMELSEARGMLADGSAAVQRQLEQQSLFERSIEIGLARERQLQSASRGAEIRSVSDTPVIDPVSGAFALTMGAAAAGVATAVAGSAANIALMKSVHGPAVMNAVHDAVALAGGGRARTVWGAGASVGKTLGQRLGPVSSGANAAPRPASDYDSH